MDIVLASTLVLGAATILLILWWKYVFTRSNNKVTVPFVDGHWPLIGHIPYLIDLKKIRNLCDKWAIDYDGTFGLYLLTDKLVITSNIKVIEDFMSNPKYNTKSNSYRFVRTLIGDGLACSSGNLWKTRRRLVVPTFHYDLLCNFMPAVEKISVEFVNLLQKYAEDGREFDIVDFSKQFTMAVICDTAMRKHVPLTIDSTTKNNGPNIKVIFDKASVYFMNRFKRPWLWNEKIYALSSEGKMQLSQRDALRNLVQIIIEDRVKFRKEGLEVNSVEKQKIFIDVLLDSFEKGEIDVQGIVDEVGTMIFAGYETTASTLSFALYCLGRNRDRQEKLFEEINRFDGSFEAFENLRNLKYLDWVIKETLRLHVIANSFQRAIPEGSVLGGKVFPKCSLMVDLKAVNHNPENWENPKKFYPERFEGFDERKKGRSQCFLHFWQKREN
ncbi:cytochrome P450 4V2-like [Clytia hemisphaerica]|uniref:cytochrome P450 4V2-like n=1 Tax=Clytia hemisphaerica TaxID=252671 RepID=UPI0034D75A23